MSDSLNVEGKEYTAAAIVAKRFGYTKDYLLLLIKGGKIDGHKIGNKWYVHAPSVESFFKNAKVRNEERRKQISLERKEELRLHTNTKFSGTHKMAVIETLAIVVIGLSLGVTGYVGTTVSNQTAYVGEGAASFLERFAISIYRLVYSGEISGEVENDETNSGTVDVNELGVAESLVIVAPTDVLESKTVDALRNSFSDPVSISVDPGDPNTGVIVPEFKSGKGEPYRFLVVPVTNAKPESTGM